MIQVGLAGWGDHDGLYRSGTKAKDKLRLYASHFPTVEVDSSFYAIQPAERVARWTEGSPDGFSFIFKANQEMTGHERGKPYFSDEDLLYGAFRESVSPALEAGKLKAVLFQYPPWFDCTQENVRLLRKARALMADLPCALEFRHQSWFLPKMREKTLAFMEQEGWIHSICDEPQAGEGSVPIVPAATQRSLTLVRMHGRHVEGWRQNGAPNWREVRYLYHYNEDELMEWRDRLLKLEEQTDEIIVLFNNNSGGDAASNAKELMALLGLRTPEGLDPQAPDATDEPPEQLSLF